jgi:Zn-dependent alcohol dehydrogenase
MAAHVVGANPIIGVDIMPSRLNLAIELGATHIINSHIVDVASGINKIIMEALIMYWRLPAILRCYSLRQR